jgi:hypothetical protein
MRAHTVIAAPDMRLRITGEIGDPVFVNTGV